MPPVTPTDWLDLEESNPFLHEPSEFDPFTIPKWRQALQANQNLPNNAITNLPGAEISLETGSALPIYSRQYVIPYSRRESYNEFVTTNLSKGILESAPVHNQWNTSMIAVPKKKVQDPSWLTQSTQPN